jgi:hypothetical protein
MKDLFYTAKDKKLFWIAGYCSSFNIKELVSTLQNHVKYFETNCKIKPVNSTEITKSSRYKNMRVYWVDTEIIPKDAYVIEDDGYWDMWKWLEN